MGDLLDPDPKPGVLKTEIRSVPEVKNELEIKKGIFQKHLLAFSNFLRCSITCKRSLIS